MCLYVFVNVFLASCRISILLVRPGSHAEGLMFCWCYFFIFLFFSSLLETNYLRV